LLMKSSGKSILLFLMSIFGQNIFLFNFGVFLPLWIIFEEL
jgi:hypothetical protein